MIYNLYKCKKLFIVKDLDQLWFHPFCEEPTASSPIFVWGTFVPLSMWVKIYFVYFNLFAISAFLLSRAVAKGY